MFKYYSVPNMPGAVPRTSTMALTNATLPYGIQIANKGVEAACRENRSIYTGLNIYNGKVTYKAVAEAFGMEYASPDSLIG